MGAESETPAVDPQRNRYRMESLAKGLQVMPLFDETTMSLRLREVVERMEDGVLQGAAARRPRRSGVGPAGAGRRRAGAVRADDARRLLRHPRAAAAGVPGR